MRTAPIINSVFIAFTATLLSFLTTPTLGHMAMGFPPAQGFDVANQKADGIIHAFMGFEGKPFPCGGYGKGAVTTLKAGEVINVRFWNFDMKKENYGQMPYKEGLKSARHGGGACEFAVSYDGGKKWGVIAQYTRTCPDIYFEWPVLIPKNIRECKNSNKCLFSWSWVAAKIGQVRDLICRVKESLFHGNTTTCKRSNLSLAPLQ